jgi:Zn-dependent peptidase ImmA (M78 family)
MSLRVAIKPKMLKWAITRAGDRGDALHEKFPALHDWIAGDSQPTLKQLESFAKAAYIPIGYLFLPDPPDEALPIADLRTMGSKRIGASSIDLLDTVHLCQQRQDWYREYSERNGDSAHEYVGSVTIKDSADKVAGAIRKQIDFSLEDQRSSLTADDTLRHFIGKAEEAGILVMMSGVVGSNNRRTLDPEEFRGFAIADPYAPLVFINGADAKAAKLFTLAHELAHIWLGESAVSNAGLASQPNHTTETWCNRVAAELLVPSESLRKELGREPLSKLQALARSYKVSTLVILRRLLDLKAIDRDEFRETYQRELRKLTPTRVSGGGDFYLTQAVRLSRRFAKALIASTLEGHTLFTDAFQMLGISKDKTFRELGTQLEVIV